MSHAPSLALPLVYKAIRRAGGAVTAAELLPFAPAPPLDGPGERKSAATVDEAFVLPIVTALQARRGSPKGGSPQTTAIHPRSR